MTRYSDSRFTNTFFERQPHVVATTRNCNTITITLCPRFPFGIHWLWHLLTALAASLLIHGIASRPPVEPRSRPIAHS